MDEEPVDSRRTMEAQIGVIRLYAGLCVLLLAAAVALLAVIAFGDGIQVEVVSI